MLIKCTGCGEEKPENHFYNKSMYKKRTDGSVKRYPKRKVRQCNRCVYLRDKMTRYKRLQLI
jgi:hypothetical protein